MTWEESCSFETFIHGYKVVVKEMPKKFEIYFFYFSEKKRNVIFDYMYYKINL